MPVIFEVSVERSAGLRRVTQQPAALVRRAGVLASKRAAEEYVDAIHEDIRARRPFISSPNAQLERSIGWHAQGAGAVVYATAPHAPYVEFGTRPHVIRPRPGRAPRVINVKEHRALRGGKAVTVRAHSYLSDRSALRWFTGGAGGGMVVAGQVNHPGTDPHPFFFHDLPGRQVRILRQARLAVAEVLLGAGAQGSA